MNLRRTMLSVAVVAAAVSVGMTGHACVAWGIRGW